LSKIVELRKPLKELTKFHCREYGSCATQIITESSIWIQLLKSTLFAHFFLHCTQITKPP